MPSILPNFCFSQLMTVVNLELGARCFVCCSWNFGEVFEADSIKPERHYSRDLPGLGTFPKFTGRMWPHIPTSCGTFGKAFGSCDHFGAHSTMKFFFQPKYWRTHPIVILDCLLAPLKCNTSIIDVILTPELRGGHSTVRPNS